MPNDGVARLERALARLAEERQQVHAIIERQQRRLAANQEVIAEGREILSRPIRQR